MLGAVKRRELPLLGRRGSGHHALDRMDLAGSRPAGVGNHQVLGLRLRQRDRLGSLGIQIDQRRTAQLQAVGGDVLFQFRAGAIQIDEHVQRPAAAGQRCGVEPGQIEEQELLRERKVLGQQAIAEERARPRRQHAFLAGKAYRLDALGAQQPGLPIRGRRRQRDAQHVVEQQLVQRIDVLRLAFQVESQPVRRQGGKRQVPGKALQLQVEDPDGTRRKRRRRRGKRPPDQFDVGQFQRPQPDRITGPEAAGLPVHRIGFQHRVTGNVIAVQQLALRSFQDKLNDGQGGDRRQVMRIQHPQHRVGQFGEVVVQLVACAGIQVRAGFDQPFDVRVFGRVRRQPQPGRDLRVRLGEFRAQSPQKRQLAIVVRQQFVVHRALPLTSISPVAGCSEESNTTSSKAGSA